MRGMEDVMGLLDWIRQKMGKQSTEPVAEVAVASAPAPQP
ncbi:MAG: hypothetical protein ACI8RZ_005075, partial [Myxococcota bacterium]